ncbi:MAG TPA: phosphatase PAP2 family protein [Terriglobales bacterium]|nr:phosphatase PAP2 family protein [Terriglobales bacterium]
MRVAEWIEIAFFSILVLGAWWRRLPSWRKLRVTAVATLAIAAVLATRFMLYFAPPGFSSVIRDWMPAALLLVAYWQIGQFVREPNHGVQARLAAFDRSFFGAAHIQPAKTAICSVPAVYLELAYLMVYPLIPLGIAALYIASLRQSADYYWVVVLLATYTCFAMTPFVPALPPRMLTGYDMFEIPPNSLRALNRWVLRRASIQAITFPSAHVASSAAAGLVIFRLEPHVGLIFLWAALSIAVATVVGGYHYAADVLFALLVAVFVFVGTFWFW